jgi:hypothetical protein
VIHINPPELLVGIKVAAYCNIPKAKSIPLRDAVSNQMASREKRNRCRILNDLGACAEDQGDDGL